MEFEFLARQSVSVPGAAFDLSIRRTRAVLFPLRSDR